MSLKKVFRKKDVNSAKNKIIGIVLIGGAVWLIGPEINTWVNSFGFPVWAKFLIGFLMVFIGVRFFKLRGLDY